MIITDINQTVQQAMRDGKYIHAKSDGKLNKIKPQKGMIIVFEDGDHGLVTKPSNSVGDFTVQMNDGSRLKKNVVNGDIKGYLIGG